MFAADKYTQNYAECGAHGTHEQNNADGHKTSK
jgi:hypothetical protein